MIDVKSVADSILKDYTKIDHVDTLYSHCQNVSTDPVTAYKCFVALGRVFLRLFDRSEIIGGCDVSRPIPDQESMGKIREWLLKYLYKYRVVTSRLLCEGNNSFKAAAAESVLILLKIDSKLTGSYDDKFFSDLIKTIIAAPREEFEGSRDALCAKMDQYADLRTLFYVSIRSILAEHRGEPGEGVLLNLYELLASLGPPENKPSTGIRARMYTHGGYSAKNEIRSFTQVWLQLLITPLPDDIVKNILLSLHKKILSHVNSPVSFMDFIIASYEKGGVFGVLALSSLHKMIIEYNIEYPNYYTKLYAILDYEVMHLKYRSRFVRLLYSSLKTSTLPAYIVAAFIKKLARIALVSPAPAVLASIPVIYNLIKIHPHLRSLISADLMNKQHSGAVEDPYILDEPEPAKCRATESSLWELMILERHYCKQISGTVKYFSEDMSKSALLDIEDFLDNTYSTLQEYQHRIQFHSAQAGYAASPRMCGNVVITNTGSNSAYILSLRLTPKSYKSYLTPILPSDYDYPRQTHEYLRTICEDSDTIKPCQ